MASISNQDQLGVQCWCGSDKKQDFSTHYFKCVDCATVFVKKREPDNYFSAGDEQSQLYNKEYWLNPAAFEKSVSPEPLPDLEQRAKLDFHDRIPFWFEHLAPFALPGAKVLEVGCSHGGFSGFLKLAGYQAEGSEMSPWVCEFAQKKFGIPMHIGTLEELRLPKESYDCLALFDVVEHLPYPTQTLREAVRLLKRSGFLMIQTPCLRNDQASFSQLEAAQDPFLKMMREWEHLYLFSETGLKKLLQSLGLNYCLTFSPLFPYDMLLIASFKKMEPCSRELIAAKLEQTPAGRLVEAFLKSHRRVQVLEKESHAQLEAIRAFTQTKYYRWKSKLNQLFIRR